METTYDFRIHRTQIYKGKRKTTHYVRWEVGKKRFRKGHSTAALADSFRSALVTAGRMGEPFDMASGLPMSMHRAQRDIAWYEFACLFVDMKWPRVAATTRRTHAEALTTVTAAMLAGSRGAPDAKVMRAALSRWGFNTVRRDDPAMPDTIRDALLWLQGNTRSVSTLANPEVLRPVLDALTVKLDGTPAAPSVVSRKRKIFNTAIEYAVERGFLAENPVPALKWTAPKTVHTVDRRAVANPVQARSILNAVRELRPSGPRLVAFFGCLYFAALRPEEAVCLAKSNLSLPAEGWGELHLERAEPFAGREWTDRGEDRDRRQLKQRARGETRTVPCPPELTALLHQHMMQFGTALDGRLFVGERNGATLPKLTILRAWKRAREAVFTDDMQASPLAKTPYDLRHAAVSTWLNGGVSPTTVAEWAGHSVEILLKIYAKCLDGEGAAVRRRVEAALGH